MRKLMLFLLMTTAISCLSILTFGQKNVSIISLRLPESERPYKYETFIMFLTEGELLTLNADINSRPADSIDIGIMDSQWDTDTAWTKIWYLDSSKKWSYVINGYNNIKDIGRFTADGYPWSTYPCATLVCDGLDRLDFLRLCGEFGAVSDYSGGEHHSWDLDYYTRKISIKRWLHLGLKTRFLSEVKKSFPKKYSNY